MPENRIRATYDTVAAAYDAVADLTAAGFSVAASSLREPPPDVGYPSRRCYLLAQSHPQRR